MARPKHGAQLVFKGLAAHLWGHSEPQIRLEPGLTLETWREVRGHCPHHYRIGLVPEVAVTQKAWGEEEGFATE